MDNFGFDVTYEGKESFVKAFLMCNRDKVVTGYKIKENKTLVLFWADSTNAEKMPYGMTPPQAAEFAYGWVTGSADYGQEPDHDGDNGKGWRIYTGDWGQINEWQAHLAIEPSWACYGK